MEPIHPVQINIIGEHQPRYDKSIPWKAVWQIYRDKANLRRRTIYTTTQSSNFRKGSFSSRDNVEPKYNLQEKDNPSIATNDFSSRIVPCLVRMNQLAESSNETNCVFLPLKLKSLFLPQCTVPHMSGSSSEANSSCYHKSNVA